MSGSTSSSGTPCPAGYFCPAGTGGANSFPCPAGTYNTLQSRMMVSECLNCPAGYYCAAASASAGVACPAGYYCPAGTGDYRVNPCPAGTHGNGATGFSNYTDCVTCPVGAYCRQASATPTWCPAGTYNPNTGGVSLLSCLLCPVRPCFRCIAD